MNDAILIANECSLPSIQKSFSQRPLNLERPLPLRLPLCILLQDIRLHLPLPPAAPPAPPRINHGLARTPDKHLALEGAADKAKGDEGDDADLFPQMVELGKQQRAAWTRWTTFCDLTEQSQKEATA